MTRQAFKQYIQEQKSVIDLALPHYIECLEAPKHLKESMLYSLNAGGKRLRPILLLATMEALGKDPAIGLPVACAVEMIHTYSLIHDDLPAMDDDDLRRGVPTNHKVFGDAMAILAGDALLTYGFQVIAQLPNEHIDAEVKTHLIAKLARAVGPEGMVGGQVADLEGEHRLLTLDELEYIHRHKTGDLLTYVIEAGAILSGATHEQLHELTAFARHLGLAFQIKDDILDIEGTEEQIGKHVGSDEENDKSTYPKLLTIKGAKEKLEMHIDRAKEHLRCANISSNHLEELTNYVKNRNS